MKMDRFLLINWINLNTDGFTVKYLFINLRLDFQYYCLLLRDFDARFTFTKPILDGE